MSIVATPEIRRHLIASVAEQVSLSLTSSQPPEDRFSHDVAH